MSWPGLPLARLRVLGTPGSHDGEFWATGTGRHWGHRLRQGPFLLPREGGLSASPGASAHRFLRLGEGSRPRSAPLHCQEGLGQRRRRRQAPSIAIARWTRAPPRGLLRNARSLGLQPRVVGPRFVKDKQETGFPAGLVSGALRSFQQRSNVFLGFQP